MLTVGEARSEVLRLAARLEAHAVQLHLASGLLLAKRAVATLDLPPFDKALMDGYAVRSADCLGPGPHLLKVGEEIWAGSQTSRPIAAGEAAVIMTGAPLPPGADAVVMHERTTITSDGRVAIDGTVRDGLARLSRGAEYRCGQVLFDAGTRLDPAVLGVLAANGVDPVSVIRPPRVLIVPTGDELVPHTETPGPGQIRESNSILLASLVKAAGAEATVCPTVPDDEDVLRSRLREAIDSGPDVILLCGGVSAGKRDLVPAALADVGVEIVFHKVRIKPGKPLLFGRLERSDGATQFVFGLPGNPVSGLVSFLVFVRPLLQRLRGGSSREEWLDPHGAILTSPFRHRGDRPTYHPAKWDRLTNAATPLAWHGSADLYAVARADGFLAFDEGDRDYEVGDSVPFLALESV